MGLVSLGICALATTVVPERPIALADRYPMVFNAIVVGFAIATAMWTRLSGVWQRNTEHQDAGLLVPLAKRFAFTCAAMGLISGAMMTLWPRLPGIATMDHSYGRVTAGFSANLLLLLVMLWTSRQIRRPTFQVLTLMCVISTIGFLAMRMIPFASHVE
jgi:hypothetical protein